jgi:hypothetical protein
VKICKLLAEPQTEQPFCFRLRQQTKGLQKIKATSGRASTVRVPRTSRLIKQEIHEQEWNKFAKCLILDLGFAGLLCIIKMARAYPSKLHPDDNETRGQADLREGLILNFFYMYLYKQRFILRFKRLHAMSFTFGSRKARGTISC